MDEHLDKDRLVFECILAKPLPRVVDLFHAPRHSDCACICLG